MGGSGSKSAIKWYRPKLSCAWISGGVSLVIFLFSPLWYPWLTEADSPPKQEKSLLTQYKELPPLQKVLFCAGSIFGVWKLWKYFTDDEDSYEPEPAGIFEKVFSPRKPKKKRGGSNTTLYGGLGIIFLVGLTASVLVWIFMIRPKNTKQVPAPDLEMGQDASRF